MKKMKYIIVVGCSRFGVNIASLFSKQSKYVVIIDNKDDGLKKLSENYSGYSIIGDGTDLSVLIDAGIKKADLVVAATNDDNVNIMISEISSKLFNVAHVVSRLYNVEKEIAYHDLNINIIKPEKLSINEFENILDLDLEMVV